MAPRHQARPGTPIHHAEVCRRLERSIAEAGSLTLAAQVMGVSPQLLSAVLAGNRAIGPKLLKALNLTRTVQKVVTYQVAAPTRRGR